MASALHRLGRTAFRRRRLVLSVWLVLFVGAFAAASTFSQPTDGAFSIPGTDSQKAIDLLEDRLPEANGGSGRVVFAAPDGETLTGESKAAVEAAITQVERTDGVQAVSDPWSTELVSADDRIALSQVSFDLPSDDIEEALVDEVQHAASQAGGAGIQVEFGGDAVVETEGSGIGEIIGLGVAALVLAITFGSLIAAGLPLLTAIIGVGMGLAGITAATGFIELSDAVPTLAMMVGLAVAIDYALFIISRHRTQLFEGMDPEESAARAVATAGSAVVFAGATVVLALAALSVVGIPFLTAMGLAAAATVTIAVLLAITLVPAMLGFAGMRLAKGKNFDTGPRSLKPTLGSRWVGVVTRHRLPALVLTMLVLGAFAIPALDMRLGMSDDSSAAPADTNRKAYDLASDAFGPGFNGPLMVVVDGAETGGRDQVRAAADRVAGELGQLPGVEAVEDPELNEAGNTAILSLIPESGPSSERTTALVEEIRDLAPGLGSEVDAEVLVTGQTAVNIDVASQLRGALIPFLLVIVGLAFILLTIAFRSILVPLTAIAGFLLTIGASLGAVVAVFQNGFAAELFGVAQAAPLVSMLPILIIGILFGLAMDYQVFLVSRMREEHVRGAGPMESITEGFRHGARVVTAAALIMGSVFAGFILEQDAIIKSVGFALAFGILIDAFLVRMTLIPAVMALLGERAWWLPGWLERILPRVDIDGAKAERPASETRSGLGSPGGGSVTGVR